MREKLNEKQNRLVTENLGLVHAVLRRYGRTRDREDLYSAGCLGLCRAAQNWVEGGSPFSTYACHYIQHEMINCIRASKKEEQCVSLEDLDFEKTIWNDPGNSGFLHAENRELLKEIDDQSPGFLDQKEAAVIRLLLRGGSPAGVAVQLNIPLSSIYKIRRSAIKRIAEWVEK